MADVGSPAAWNHALDSLISRDLRGSAKSPIQVLPVRGSPSVSHRRLTSRILVWRLSGRGGQSCLPRRCGWIKRRISGWKPQRTTDRWTTRILPLEGESQKPSRSLSTCPACTELAEVAWRRVSKRPATADAVGGMPMPVPQTSASPFRPNGHPIPSVPFVLFVANLSDSWLHLNSTPILECPISAKIIKKSPKIATSVQFSTDNSHTNRDIRIPYNTIYTRQKKTAGLLTRKVDNRRSPTKACSPCACLWQAGPLRTCAVS